jgi:DNA-binding transcriptional ArsR family regulator
MGDASGIGDGDGITKRAGGISVGGRVAAMVGLLLVPPDSRRRDPSSLLVSIARGTNLPDASEAKGEWLVATMYHVFMKLASRNMQLAPQTRATRWDFLTNHAHVLTCVAGDPGIRLRDIAVAVGITERAAHRILSELVDEGYVLRERDGRRNRYQVVPERPLRHPLVAERAVGDLLRVLAGSASPRERARPT